MLKLESAGMAKILKKFFKRKFGGRGKGPYLISRILFRKLSGRNILDDEFVRLVQQNIYERGCTFIDLGDYFSVLKTPSTKSYRKVTKKVIAKEIERIESDNARDKPATAIKKTPKTAKKSTEDEE